MWAAAAGAPSAEFDDRRASRLSDPRSLRNVAQSHRRAPARPMKLSAYLINTARPDRE
jgi:hypothetical protein